MEVVAEHGDHVTWRSVAFTPSGDHAVLVGDRSTGEGTRDMVATWSPEDGLEIVLDRPGTGLVDVSIDGEGRHLIVGLQDTVLLGEAGAYRNVWNESAFAQQAGLTFYGLAGAFEPGEQHALLAGSSLVRMNADGSFGEEEVVHGGEGAFFRSVDWNPRASSAFVEAAIEHEGEGACEGTGTVFGTIWRTDGASPLTDEDHVSVFGKNEPGCGLANAISHAPNGTFALIAGRDEDGSSLYTWAAERGEGVGDPDAWRYQVTEKNEGAISCIAWHPTGRYAVTVGLEADVVGVASERSWAPLVHEGPDLHGCAMHPEGAYALGVGADGTVVQIPHVDAPVGAVVQPEADTLVSPQEEEPFLVDVMDRGGAGNVSVTATVRGQEAVFEGFLMQPWWEVPVNTSGLPDGHHTLEVRVSTQAGSMLVTHPFLVNQDRFQPDTPTILEPSGLEGDGQSTTGVFTVEWEPLDQAVLYEVREEKAGADENGTRILQAGSGASLSVQASEEGQYMYSVRAKNAFNASTWSSTVIVNVVFDERGAHAGEGDFRECPSPSDGDEVSWRECVLGIDQDDDADTDGEDGGSGGDDDGGDEGRPVPGPGLVALGIASVGGALIRRGTVGEK